MEIVSSSSEKYDVFVSFNMEDTGNNFASHLCTALHQKKMKAAYSKLGCKFLADSCEEIRESKLSVVIFSENYAWCERCLDELSLIIQCKERNGQIVLPIFYNINPSHIRKQDGSYGAAIASHSNEKLQQWKDASTKAANLSGWDSSVARPESKLVQQVVEDILQKLYTISPINDAKGLIGMDKRIEKIESLLQTESSDQCVRIVGIYGASGIGKTALARAVFNKLTSQFEGSHFIENVKTEMETLGLDRLQRELFSALLNQNIQFRINGIVKERLRSTKVLIVIDDVDDFEQFECLAGDGDWFSRGSKIIVTTSDEQVLDNIGVSGKYLVEELNPDEALKLFCSKAFGRNSPETEFVELSKRMVSHAKGVPLALKDLGNRLSSRTIHVWRSQLSKLEKNSLVGL